MDFLTVNETAQRLRVSPITVRRYIASGRLAAERAGRGIRVQREAIEAFITPVAPASHGTTVVREVDLETTNGSPGTSGDEYGDELRTVADRGWDEDEDDACLADELGEPFTMDDPLWDIVGIGDSGEPNHVASNKHKYIADAILSKMR